MRDSDKQVDHDQLGVLAGVLLLAIVLMRFSDVPVRPLFQTTVLGSALGLRFSVANLMLIIILGLSLTGVTSLVRRHPLAQRGQVEAWTMFWIMPGLLNLALASWLHRIARLETWIVALSITALLISMGMVVQYRAVDPITRQSRSLRWQQTALIHLTAVFLYTLIYDARIRSLLSATAILFTTTLLAARLFWINGIPASRVYVYGGLVGLILGQMTWGLNYLPLSGMQGGLCLLLVFYVIVGLLQQFLQGQFENGPGSRRVLIEYGGVALAILLLIALAAP